MKILGFGTYNTSVHPRAGILLEGLKDAGHTVREINEPSTVSTESRVEALSSPKAAAGFFGNLAKNWSRLIKASAQYRGEYSPDVVVVGYLGHFDVVLARILFRKATIVLDHLIYAADTAADGERADEHSLPSYRSLTGLPLALPPSSSTTPRHTRSLRRSP